MDELGTVGICMDQECHYFDLSTYLFISSTATFFERRVSYTESSGLLPFVPVQVVGVPSSEGPLGAGIGNSCIHDRLI